MPKRVNYSGKPRLRDLRVGAGSFHPWCPGPRHLRVGCGRLRGSGTEAAGWASRSSKKAALCVSMIEQEGREVMGFIPMIILTIPRIINHVCGLGIAGLASWSGRKIFQNKGVVETIRIRLLDGKLSLLRFLRLR